MSYSENGKRRIRDAVRKAEQTKNDVTGKKLADPKHHSEFLLVKLTEMAPKEDGPPALPQRFSWKEQRRIESGAYEDVPEGREGLLTENPAVLFLPTDSADVDDIVFVKRQPYLREGDNGPEWEQVWVIIKGDHNLWVKITGATPVPEKFNKWQYSWIEQIPELANVWKDKPGARSSATTGIQGHNTCEANNQETGRQGNSVDVDELPTGDPPFALQPVSGSPIVRAEIRFDCEGDYHLFFQYENAVTGDCPADPAP